MRLRASLTCPPRKASGRGLTKYAEGGEGGAPDFMVRQSVGYRFVKDHLGSVRRVINATTGAVVQELDYDAFGKVLSDSNPGFQPFGFAGGLYDTDTSLVHFGAREYSASTGRWTNIDPIGFAGGQTNLYAYVDSDPVNRVDPAGTTGFALGIGLSWGGSIGKIPLGPAFTVSAGVAFDWSSGTFTAVNWASGGAGASVGSGTYWGATVNGTFIQKDIEHFAGKDLTVSGYFGDGWFSNLPIASVMGNWTLGVGFGYGLGGGPVVTCTEVSGVQVKDTGFGSDTIPFSRNQCLNGAQ